MCAGLKHWTTQESSIFPHLEQLRLFELKELEEIPLEIGDVPTLQRIKLVLCNELAVMCAKEIEDEQVKLQGDQLSFRFVVRVSKRRIGALRSLAGPNFEVLV